MVFSILVAVASVLGIILLLFVWLVAYVYLQHRRIKTFCVAVGRRLTSLRMQRGAEFADELCTVDKESFIAVKNAFKSYIRPHVQYRERLLGALNKICGTSYTVMDMYDCFDNGRLNSFFRDIVGGSGYLFINLLYLARLEQNGFRPVDMSAIDRHL